MLNPETLFFPVVSRATVGAKQTGQQLSATPHRNDNPICPGAQRTSVRTILTMGTATKQNNSTGQSPNLLTVRPTGIVPATFPNVSAPVARPKNLSLK